MKTLVALLFATGVAMAAPEIRWDRQPQTLTLLRDGKTVWTLHHDPAEGKPYFHPLAMPDGAVFTDLRPADHPWHRGLWWSWKFINGANYWEEDKKTGLSQGRTELVDTKIETQPDGSARIRLSLRYRLPDQPAVLEEERDIVVGAPAADGGYRLDWRSVFTARTAVKLERTPPQAPSGKASWGGYAGLALRMGATQKSWDYRSGDSDKKGDDLNGLPARWVDAAGPSGGVLFLDHPANPRHPTPWRVSPQMPYLSPSPLYGSALEIAPGAKLDFHYRLWVHAQALTAADCRAEWESFGAKP